MQYKITRLGKVPNLVIFTKTDLDTVSFGDQAP
jgi:hypothetical protein